MDLQIALFWSTGNGRIAVLEKGQILEGPEKYPAWCPSNIFEILHLVLFFFVKRCSFILHKLKNLKYYKNNFTFYWCWTVLHFFCCIFYCSDAKPLIWTRRVKLLSFTCNFFNIISHILTESSLYTVSIQTFLYSRNGEYWFWCWQQGQKDLTEVSWTVKVFINDLSTSLESVW